MITRAKLGIFKPKAYTISLNTLPRSILAVLLIPVWKEAMLAEFLALLRNKTWTITVIPPGKKLIGCTWIFKIKKHVDGSIARHKARLIAQECPLSSLELRRSVNIAIKQLDSQADGVNGIHDTAMNKVKILESKNGMPPVHTNLSWKDILVGSVVLESQQLIESFVERHRQALGCALYKYA
ncbi:hypothetical protein SASPL_105372 [Salvia splendens]|uniref:Reverse transcriptase Ty1/copia-type domain-containing protein n=1 Tax=Salvia splendens TaxID=180675 RepID=A0A8X8YPE5_SALSN|nr:hypothetical protein SASPL_105372 [Salvia splendens]